MNQDIRHNLQLNWIAELPFGRGKTSAQEGAAAAILGGWQLNGLLSAYTGRPFTVTASGTSLNAQGAGQFADCIAPPRKIGSTSEWYDKSSFAPVTEPRFGSCRSNILSGPGLVNLDVGVFRRFQLGERFNLQFRAEAFNISNTPHFSSPNGNASSGSFLVISSQRNIGREGINERPFRFGLRLGF